MSYFPTFVPFFDITHFHAGWFGRPPPGGGGPINIFLLFLTSCFLDPVPIVLEGEGHYALAAVKDIRVTDEFVGLGQGITHCQTEDFRADCVTRKLREKILQSCQCSPAYMRSYSSSLVNHRI